MVTGMLALAASGMLPAAAAVAEWPQLGGAHMDSISPETGLAGKWPEKGPKVVWRVPLNKGFGGAAVKGGKVYLMGREARKRDILRCLELATGKELWTFSYPAPRRFAPAGSRTIPAVDDRYVFITGPVGHLHCLDRATHKVVWQKDLIKEFDGRVPRWGFAQSPVPYKDLVIVAPQGRKAGVAAFRKATGKVVWRSPFFPEMTGGGWGRSGNYISPVAGTICGVDQVVMATCCQEKSDGSKGLQGRVVGISAKDGKVLWTYKGWQGPCPIARPAILSKQSQVFLTADYGAGSAMIRIAKKGEQFTVGELFKTMECGGQLHQPVVFEGHIYVNSTGKSRSEGLMCLGLDGKVIWHTSNSKFVSQAAEGLPEFNRGNVLLADGKLYVLDGKTGDLRMVKATPAGYKELACVKAILSGKQIWAPMALSDGKLLIRDQSQMKCLDVRSP